MVLLELFRSFLPLRNPIGFGASDFVELGLAALLMALGWITRPYLEPRARRLAERTRLVRCSLLAVLPVALAAGFCLPHHPVPSPADLYDEFGHLLVADTLRIFDWRIRAHPLHQFFETFFVLQEPTYSSIYPLGPGLGNGARAGRSSGMPWAGVLLGDGARSARCATGCCAAWTTPAWALVGGLLAVIEFGPLNQWMQQLLGRRRGGGGGLPGVRGFASLAARLAAETTRCCWARGWVCIC